MLLSCMKEEAIVSGDAFIIHNKSHLLPLTIAKKHNDIGVVIHVGNAVSFTVESTTNVKIKKHTFCKLTNFWINTHQASAHWKPGDIILKTNSYYGPHGRNKSINLIFMWTTYDVLGYPQFLKHFYPHNKTK